MYLVKNYTRCFLIRKTKHILRQAGRSLVGCFLTSCEPVCLTCIVFADSSKNMLIFIRYYQEQNCTILGYSANISLSFLLLKLFMVYVSLSRPSGIGFAQLPHFGKTISASYSTSPMCLSHLAQRIIFVSYMFNLESLSF